MNIKTSTLIREACAFARLDLNLRLLRDGAWFEWNAITIVATDPIGAVILKAGALPWPSTPPPKIEDMVRPGLLQIAQRLLEVDHFWLYRFWMGYDRNYQIKFINEKDDTETKDEVSEFGITLARELFR